MGRKGFTLVETLVVMVILGLIGGAIMAFYPISAKLFMRGSAESQAGSTSFRAVQRMGPIVREAMNLNVVVRDAGTGECRLEVSLPQKQLDVTTNEKLVVFPLTVAKEVAFYRSDNTGSLDVVGEYFWQAEKIGGTFLPSKVLARGVTSFTCPTVNTTPPKGCEVRVASRGTQDSRQAQVTYREYLMCRNS